MNHGENRLSQEDHRRRRELETGKDLQQTVDDFRRGQYTRAQAESRLQDIPRRVSIELNEHYDTARTLRPFMEPLNAHERLVGQAEGRGRPAHQQGSTTISPQADQGPTHREDRTIVPSRPLSSLPPFADAHDDSGSEPQSIHVDKLSKSSTSADSDPDRTFYQRHFLHDCDDTSAISDTASSDSDQDSHFEDSMVEDVTQDPCFAPRGALFNDDDDPDTDADLEQRDLPPAFYDHPAVRNAYIRVFVGCAFENMTHSAARLMLDGFAVALASRASQTEMPGLDTFARTLATVEKRLGVSTEGFMTYLFVCDVCWQVHTPKELSTLPGSGKCTNEECTGNLFT
ncbi:hypothetical protein B0H13DRAFT_2306453 [Mycena leptocephala]|nr:hypothetical protein B0H13DRAFT_2306453 [Mycena leptocephala]